MANNINAVVTAADDLNEATSEIDTVATNITNVNLVGNNISNINAIGTVLAGQTTFAITVASGVFYVDGASKPTINLIRGYTYIFNQADNSNSGHPLAFKDAGGSAYTTGVQLTAQQVRQMQMLLLLYLQMPLHHYVITALYMAIIWVTPLQ